MIGGIRKIGPVQHIKYFPTEDQYYPLREGSGLDHSNVSDALIGPAENISSEVAQYRLATGNRIFAINKATIWNKRRQRSHRGRNLPHGGLLCVRRGQSELKGCAPPGVAGGPQAAAVRFNNGAADPQSHARAVSLGGKE